MRSTTFFFLLCFYIVTKILEGGPELLDILDACRLITGSWLPYLCQINLDALLGEKKGSGLKKVM